MFLPIVSSLSLPRINLSSWLTLWGETKCKPWNHSGEPEAVSMREELEVTVVAEHREKVELTGQWATGDITQGTRGKLRI